MSLYDRLAATANPQPLSPLFSTLPAEIRQLIYIEFWRLSGSDMRQHIFKRSTRPEIQDSEGRWGDLTPPPGLWTHVACVTDPRKPDVRYSNFQAVSTAIEHRQEAALWASRLRSEWCIHWPCEEADPCRPSQVTRQSRRELVLGGGTIAHFPANGSDDERYRQHSATAVWSPFLPVMLTCKRMYLECVSSIYSNLTFIFTDLLTAGDFLRMHSQRTPEQGNIRSLELSVRVINILSELYFPPTETEGRGPHGRRQERVVASKYVSMEANPWATVCDHLVAMPNLHDLRIWFDTRDLRPWHNRVSEARLFAKLAQVNVQSSKSRFILALPTLAANRGLDPQHFFEGDCLEDLPFVVERAPRANNWEIHLFFRS
ncbi:hypothetical protein B0H63DRAFT_464082 [Podospora didyma]|uniref:DUF7730 domain-containing protein n=1 Tax=Podospora didyma TaxID=330526 RepID=A0AAE0U3H6_9PEZI|nr:hypothetical protein B0H63DRAFT_464082 [Podospora didyma]